jgi:hypothetical protein
MNTKPDTTASPVRRTRARRARRTVAAIGVGLTTMLAAATLAAPGAEADAGNGDRIQARSTNGQRAIDQLGDRIDEVARKAGVSRAELTKRLREDRSLRVDENLNALYVDEAPAVDSSLTTAPTPVYPTSQTFALHSRPASTKKIYLDFTGHTTSGTAWNSTFTGGQTFTSAPFDADRTPGVWSTTEHAIIQRVYLSMREDFAPFDVDVTTQDPGVASLTKSSSTDTAYGVRVVISPTDFLDCGCGGKGYVSSFTWSTDTPVFVMTNSSKRDKFIAEAAAHETGHATGLHHDGKTDGTEYYTGQGSWAPIMGVAYTKAVSHWSRGQYTGANNTQDDFAVMRANGLAYVADDVAGTTATTATLPAGTKRYGRIGQTGDVDTYKFSLTRTSSLTITAWNDNGGMDANLNARMVLKNGSGATVKTASPTNSQGATMTVTVPAGTYYLYLDGVGEGSATVDRYTSYGSVGYYGIVLNWA